ncbi:NAD(P)-binding protein [Ramaria rubella]|nr:NAD(P)-binding protein [Ramaria rubella]
MYGLFKRTSTIFNPPKVAKDPNPLKFGILGAAAIAPLALILAARSHAEAEVAAVAARDEQKAKSFAKKHDIAKVYYGPRGYQELIDDPNIDVIYNPLPNGLHFEWSAKALAAGKHVLLEKPSTTSSEETLKLFEIAASKGVVLLEAFHFRFHPAFIRLMEVLESGEFGKVLNITSELAVPRSYFKNDDIRFDFDLGGGALLDMGCYPILAVRTILSAEPTSVLTANHKSHLDPNIDRMVQATFTFPNDVTADIFCDLQMPWYLGIIPPWPKLHITVQLEGGQVCLYNFPGAHFINSITITPKDGKKRVERIYKPKEGKGEDWWTTYRYQLEAFVDKVRGRAPHTWMSGTDSVNQMRALEMVYEKIGLSARPKSSYVP